MDRSALLQLLPYRDAALWLESVTHHDAQHICGLTDWRHLQAFANPDATCLLYEAAAQLCVTHAKLHGPAAGERGLVGKLLDVRQHLAPSRHSGSVPVTAQLLAFAPGGARYRFALEEDARTLVDGELLLVLTDA